MKSRLLIFTSLALIWLLSGCSVEKTDQSETDMGTHHVVVKPGSTLTTSSSATWDEGMNYQFSCGDTSISIRNEELIVNDLSYGQLQPGEEVLVDHGKVYVDGKQRTGAQVSEDSFWEPLSENEIKEELAGYSVTVRPGASSTSVMESEGKHTLTVGNTIVTIEKDKLFVTDKSSGPLKQGDTILIENSKITVSGEIRQTAD